MVLFGLLGLSGLGGSLGALPGCATERLGTDSDGDGLTDEQEALFGTDPRVPDTDRDGVPDGKDLERNTPFGKPVDEFGRALKEQEVTLIREGFIRLNAVYFDVGKATIRAESNDALNEVAEILKKYPTIKIEVQGHTDITGARAKNIKLSQARAQAVLEYLVARDSALNRNNFTAVGYGPDKPIADNKTAEGKQLNRRVEFVVLNKEVLQEKIIITPK